MIRKRNKNWLNSEKIDNHTTVNTKLQNTKQKDFKENITRDSIKYIVQNIVQKEGSWLWKGETRKWVVLSK